MVGRDRFSLASRSEQRDDTLLVVELHLEFFTEAPQELSRFPSLTSRTVSCGCLQGCRATAVGREMICPYYIRYVASFTAIEIS